MEARKQRALEARAHVAATASSDGAVAGAEAEMYPACAQMHLALARSHEARADGKGSDADRAQQEADGGREQALAAQEHADGVRHRAAAQGDQQQAGSLEEQERGPHRGGRAGARGPAAGRAHPTAHRPAGDPRAQRLARLRPGPGNQLFSPGMLSTASRWAPTAEPDLDREIKSIGRALDERGPLARDELADLVGGHYWDPGASVPPSCRGRRGTRGASGVGQVRADRLDEP